MKQNLALILAILFTFCCFSQQDGLQEYGIQLLSSENEYLNVLMY